MMRGRAELAGWLARQVRGLLPLVGLSALARVLSQLLGVALFVTAAAGILAAAGGQPVPVATAIALLAGIALAKAGLRYLEHYLGHWVAFTALQRLRELFFARLVPQAPAATRGAAGAELTARATRDIDRVEVFFAHTMPPAISAIAVPGIAITWLAMTADARIAVILALVTIASLLVPVTIGALSWRAGRRIAARRGELSARVDDDVQGIREVLGFGIQRTRLRQLDAADRRLAAARSRSGAVDAVRGGLVTVIQAAGIIAITLLAGTVPLPQLATGLAVAIGLRVPVRGVDDFIAGLDAAFAAAERVREIIDAPPLVRDTGRLSGPAAACGASAGARIEFDEVRFRYRGDDDGTAVLRDVSGCFEAGAWSYIAGASGCGKSTLASLLLRGWEPQGGQIRLDGTPLAQFSLDALRQQIALVPQRPVLVSGTLAENLRLSAPDAPEEAIWEALAVVALDAWVAGLPQGLDSPVRGRGADVSGGQLQRLALARALVARPRVLVLDEALSQLDEATARLVRDRLAAHASGCTILEITHRADLIPDDAHVLVLDAGQVRESGRAAALRRAGGAFARLEARVR